MTNHICMMLLLPALICGCKRRSAVRIIDPNPQFQKAFEMVDRIEFTFPLLGHEESLKNMIPRPKELVASLIDQDDIKHFFKIVAFVPYAEGASLHCECDGEPIVRAYSNNAELGQFTIHHGQSIRWAPLGTDVFLTPVSVKALEIYLNEKVYSETAPSMERQLPMPPVNKLFQGRALSNQPF